MLRQTVAACGPLAAQAQQLASARVAKKAARFAAGRRIERDRGGLRERELTLAVASAHILTCTSTAGPLMCAYARDRVLEHASELA